MFFGNLLGGFLGDTLGRKPVLSIAYLSVFFVSLLSVMSKSYSLLVFFRFLMGVAFGIGQPVATVFISEVVPTDWRATVVLTQCSFAVGELYAAFLVWWDDDNMLQLDWRALTILGTLPAFFAIVYGYLNLQESPRWLAYHNRLGEASEALNYFRDMNRPNFGIPDMGMCRLVGVDQKALRIKIQKPRSLFDDNPQLHVLGGMDEGRKNNNTTTRSQPGSMLYFHDPRSSDFLTRSVNRLYGTLTQYATSSSSSIEGEDEAGHRHMLDPALKKRINAARRNKSAASQQAMRSGEGSAGESASSVEIVEDLENDNDMEAALTQMKQRMLHVLAGYHGDARASGRVITTDGTASQPLAVGAGAAASRSTYNNLRPTRSVPFAQRFVSAAAQQPDTGDASSDVPTVISSARPSSVRTVDPRPLHVIGGTSARSDPQLQQNPTQPYGPRDGVSRSVALASSQREDLDGHPNTEYGRPLFYFYGEDEQQESDVDSSGNEQVHDTLLHSAADSARDPAQRAVDQLLQRAAGEGAGATISNNELVGNTQLDLSGRAQQLTHDLIANAAVGSRAASNELIANSELDLSGRELQFMHQLLEHAEARLDVNASLTDNVVQDLLYSVNRVGQVLDQLQSSSSSDYPGRSFRLPGQILEGAHRSEKAAKVATVVAEGEAAGPGEGATVDEDVVEEAAATSAAGNRSAAAAPKQVEAEGEAAGGADELQGSLAVVEESAGAPAAPVQQPGAPPEQQVDIVVESPPSPIQQNKDAGQLVASEEVVQDGAASGALAVGDVLETPAPEENLPFWWRCQIEVYEPNEDLFYTHEKWSFRSNTSDLHLPPDLSAENPRKKIGICCGLLTTRYWPITSFLCFLAFVVNFGFYGFMYAAPQNMSDVQESLWIRPGTSLMVGAFVDLLGCIAGTMFVSRMTRKAGVCVYLMLAFLGVLLFLTALSFSPVNPYKIIVDEKKGEKGRLLSLLQNRGLEVLTAEDQVVDQSAAAADDSARTVASSSRFGPASTNKNAKIIDFNTALGTTIIYSKPPPAPVTQREEVETTRGSGPSSSATNLHQHDPSPFLSFLDLRPESNADLGADTDFGTTLIWDRRGDNQRKQSSAWNKLAQQEAKPDSDAHNQVVGGGRGVDREHGVDHTSQLQKNRISLLEVPKNTGGTTPSTLLRGIQDYPTDDADVDVPQAAPVELQELQQLSDINFDRLHARNAFGRNGPAGLGQGTYMFLQEEMVANRKSGALSAAEAEEDDSVGSEMLYNDEDDEELSQVDEAAAAAQAEVDPEKASELREDVKSLNLIQHQQDEEQQQGLAAEDDERQREQQRDENRQISSSVRRSDEQQEQNQNYDPDGPEVHAMANAYRRETALDRMENDEDRQDLAGRRSYKSDKHHDPEQEAEARKEEEADGEDSAGEEADEEDSSAPGGERELQEGKKTEGGSGTAFLQEDLDFPEFSAAAAEHRAGELGQMKSVRSHQKEPRVRLAPSSITTSDFEVGLASGLGASFTGLNTEEAFVGRARASLLHKADEMKNTMKKRAPGTRQLNLLQRQGQAPAAAAGGGTSTAAAGGATASAASTNGTTNSSTIGQYYASARAGAASLGSKIEHGAYAVGYKTKEVADYAIDGAKNVGGHIREATRQEFVEPDPDTEEIDNRPFHLEWLLQLGFIVSKFSVHLGFAVLYVFSCELYPTEIRTCGAATCMAVGRLGALSAPIAYELCMTIWPLLFYIVVLILYALSGLVLRQAHLKEMAGIALVEADSDADTDEPVRGAAPWNFRVKDEKPSPPPSTLPSARDLPPAELGDIDNADEAGVGVPLTGTTSSARARQQQIAATGEGEAAGDGVVMEEEGDEALYKAQPPQYGRAGQEPAVTFTRGLAADAVAPPDRSIETVVSQDKYTGAGIDKTVETIVSQKSELNVVTTQAMRTAGALPTAAGPGGDPDAMGGQITTGQAAEDQAQAPSSGKRDEPPSLQESVAAQSSAAVSSRGPPEIPGMAVALDTYTTSKQQERAVVGAEGGVTAERGILVAGGGDAQAGVGAAGGTSTARQVESQPAGASGPDEVLAASTEKPVLAEGEARELLASSQMQSLMESRQSLTHSLMASSMLGQTVSDVKIEYEEESHEEVLPTKDALDAERRKDALAVLGQTVADAQEHVVQARDDLHDNLVQPSMSAHAYGKQKEALAVLGVAVEAAREQLLHEKEVTVYSNEILQSQAAVTLEREQNALAVLRQAVVDAQALFVGSKDELFDDSVRLSQYAKDLQRRKDARGAVAQAMRDTREIFVQDNDRLHSDEVLRSKGALEDQRQQDARDALRDAIKDAKELFVQGQDELHSKEVERSQSAIEAQRAQDAREALRDAIADAQELFVQDQDALHSQEVQRCRSAIEAQRKQDAAQALRDAIVDGRELFVQHQDELHSKEVTRSRAATAAQRTQDAEQALRDALVDAKELFVQDQDRLHSKEVLRSQSAIEAQRTQDAGQALRDAVTDALELFVQHQDVLHSNEVLRSRSAIEAQRQQDAAAALRDAIVDGKELFLQDQDELHRKEVLPSQSAIAAQRKQDAESALRDAIVDGKELFVQDQDELHSKEVLRSQSALARQRKQDAEDALRDAIKDAKELFVQDQDALHSNEVHRSKAAIEQQRKQDAQAALNDTINDAKELFVQDQDALHSNEFGFSQGAIADQRKRDALLFLQRTVSEAKAHYLQFPDELYDDEVRPNEAAKDVENRRNALKALEQAVQEAKDHYLVGHPNEKLFDTEVLPSDSAVDVERRQNALAALKNAVKTAQELYLQHEDSLYENAVLPTKKQLPMEKEELLREKKQEQEKQKKVLDFLNTAVTAVQRELAEGNAEYGKSRRHPLDYNTSLSNTEVEQESESQEEDFATSSKPASNKQKLSQKARAYLDQNLATAQQELLLGQEAQQGGKQVVKEEKKSAKNNAAAATASSSREGAPGGGRSPPTRDGEHFNAPPSSKESSASSKYQAAPDLTNFKATEVSATTTLSQKSGAAPYDDHETTAKDELRPHYYTKGRHKNPESDGARAGVPMTKVPLFKGRDGEMISSPLYSSDDPDANGNPILAVYSSSSKSSSSSGGSVSPGEPPEVVKTQEPPGEGGPGELQEFTTSSSVDVSPDDHRSPMYGVGATGGTNTTGDFVLRPVAPKSVVRPPPPQLGYQSQNQQNRTQVPASSPTTRAIAVDLDTPVDEFSITPEDDGTKAKTKTARSNIEQEPSSLLGHQNAQAKRKLTPRAGVSKNIAFAQPTTRDGEEQQGASTSSASRSDRSSSSASAQAQQERAELVTRSAAGAGPKPELKKKKAKK
ncbi:unnamed protein product [Amoebophrya sp. A120]|nr:unnamed protein product [Amoebophrya sp. A120]|eukprot:GSA120T00010705001.1